MIYPHKSNSTRTSSPRRRSSPSCAVLWEAEQEAQEEEGSSTLEQLTILVQEDLEEVQELQALVPASA